MTGKFNNREWLNYIAVFRHYLGHFQEFLEDHKDFYRAQTTQKIIDKTVDAQYDAICLMDELDDVYGSELQLIKESIEKNTIRKRYATETPTTKKYDPNTVPVVRDVELESVKSELTLTEEAEKLLKAIRERGAVKSAGGEEQESFSENKAEQCKNEAPPFDRLKGSEKTTHTSTTRPYPALMHYTDSTPTSKNK
jgi:hypothetical protein